jgi:hypothetical protein
LHLIVQGASSPQATVQLEAPVQSTVHPPSGQSMVHVLFPVHATVDPVSTSTLHVLPPPHVTVLSIPVETVQLLVPSQVVVQSDRQLPWQMDLPAHDVVQPVPQIELQVFLEEQRSLTSFGGGTPPSANAPPPADGPNVQVPPVLQVHTVPEQLQSPEQPAKAEGVLPPQLSGKAAPTATMSVTPTDSDPTDRDTFTSSVVQAGRSAVTPIAWTSDSQHNQQLVCRLTAGVFPCDRGCHATEAGRKTGNLVTRVATRLQRSQWPSLVGLVPGRHSMH